MKEASLEQIYAALPEDIKSSLQRLAEAFLKANGILNLSAHRTIERTWKGNVMDSLAACAFLQEFSIVHFPFSMLDLGTGGGFPLLPLAIVYPKHQCTGLDSVGKKVEAVRRIAKEMNLSNVTLLAGRTEDLGHDQMHREHYDVVSARAVGQVPMLLEYCAPFTKVGNHILLWKSMDIEDDISSASRAEAELFVKRIDAITYDLGDTWGKRQILVYEKTQSTPKEYPRPVGTAKKHPL